ncbi:cytochrome c oxidase subunit II [Gaetbulibacter aestuarii]|uniref:cytochrome-c oxidase n=1 Tax=Gaetbulibacter aestuarii TaxID=1502358 RepID=A0ABW7MZW9_9FLAO
MGNILSVYTNDVDRINELFRYFLVVAAIIFLLVVGYTFYYVFKYQSKKQLELPNQEEGSDRIEIILATIATVITAVFVYLTITSINTIQKIPEHPKPFLEITGHQWWWEAKYPQSGVITANQIYIPTGKKILLKLTSADVVHDWWVYKLGRKIDMIPGRYNYMYMYADKPGEYLGACSEFCGVEHARMRIRVIALKPKDFKVWQKHQLQPVVSKPKDALFEKGKELFEEKTCTNCHAINGTPHKEDIGPNLTHFGSRKRFLSDMLVNNKTNLTAWITNPQNVKSGAKMPNFILSKSEIKALVTYLHNLK